MKNESFRQRVCVILGICVAAVITGAVFFHRAEAVAAETSKLQKEMAKEVFRFHVLANSDSEEDQRVKLNVRDAVLAYMKENLGHVDSQEETKEWVRSHLDELEAEADRILEEENCDYRAQAEVTVCDFPEKRYGDVTFPAGKYEALRIRLGKADGHNWWCVLYPNLCFIDTACTAVSEEGKEELRGVFTEEEYELVTTSADFKIRWFFFGGNDD